MKIEDIKAYLALTIIVMGLCIVICLVSINDNLKEINKSLVLNAYEQVKIAEILKGGLNKK